MSPKSTLLVVYNASGTLTGHIAYGYHHIRNTAGKDCSACVLTHGARLSLSERGDWLQLKDRIEQGRLPGAEGKAVAVRTLHTEDITQEIRDFMQNERLGQPCVLLSREGASTHMSKIFDKTELDAVAGNLIEFEERLAEKLNADACLI